LGFGVWGIIPRDIRDVGERRERRGSFKADEFQGALSAATRILLSSTGEQVSLVELEDFVRCRGMIQS
jgi:hypothetical protein